MHTDNHSWVNTMRETTVSYRRMIDATIEQLTDDELFARPAPAVNSVAIILRHLGGNLISRWTDFLTTDGENLIEIETKNFKTGTVIGKR